MQDKVLVIQVLEGRANVASGEASNASETPGCGAEGERNLWNHYAAAS